MGGWGSAGQISFAKFTPSYLTEPIATRTYTYTPAESMSVLIALYLELGSAFTIFLLFMILFLFLGLFGFNQSLARKSKSVPLYTVYLHTGVMNLDLIF